MKYNECQTKYRGVKMQISLRLPEKLIQMIDKEAESQTRSRTNMIEHILTEWFREKETENPKSGEGKV